METVMDTKTKEAMRVLMWLKYNELDTFTRQNIFKDLFNSTFDYVSYDVIDDVLDQEVLRGNIEVVCRTVLPAILRKVKKKMQMMHSTYDEKRILDWIAHQPTDKRFTRDTVIYHLAPINFGLIDYVLDHEVERGSIRKSGLTGRYYVKKESNNMSDTEKRLSDLETVDTKIKNRLLDIEVVLKKISDKIDALSDKKPRLWTPWVNSKFSKVPRGTMVDVMLAKGEVVPVFPSNELFWCDNLPDEDKIVAWRASE
jgi:hypothetical protein